MLQFPLCVLCAFVVKKIDGTAANLFRIRLAERLAHRGVAAGADGVAHTCQAFLVVGVKRERLQRLQRATAAFLTDDGEQEVEGILTAREGDGEQQRLAQGEIGEVLPACAQAGEGAVHA